MPAWKFNKILILITLVVISTLGYVFLGYGLERSQHFSLVAVYFSLFVTFFLFVRQFKEHTRLLSLLALLFRLLLLTAIPGLSQDFYRFIWDGRVILEGYNPYLYSPNALIQGGNFSIPQAGELVQGMGPLSAGNLSNYPPLNQFIFVVSGWISGQSILGSVIVMRLLIILADCGILLVGIKLLKKLHLPIHSIFWYLLNPLVIIEMTGNLHFESVMLFFLLLSLYLITINWWKLGAVAFAFSVSVKLIPLMIIPLLFHRLGRKNWIAFCGIVGGLTAGFFMPFLSQGVLNSYLETTSLWFQKFEFNASIYYLLRELGYLYRGYNEIGIIGLVLSLFVLFFVIYRSLKKTTGNMISLLMNILLVVSVYFFTATTVHPWYIATPLLLSIFTPYKYVQVWSLFIVLSYLAYINTTASENALILFIEYGVVYAIFLYEMQRKDPNPTLS